VGKRDKALLSPRTLKGSRIEKGGGRGVCRRRSAVDHAKNLRHREKFS